MEREEAIGESQALVERPPVAMLGPMAMIDVPPPMASQEVPAAQRGEGESEPLGGQEMHPAVWSLGDCTWNSSTGRCLVGFTRKRPRSP